MKFLKIPWYVLTLVVLVVWYGCVCIFAALVRVKHRPGGIYDRAGRGWGRSLLAVNGLGVRVDGMEHLEPGRSYVFASNHTSFADIWVLFAHLPGSVRFVAKKELLSIPIFGQALRARGEIPINRTNLRDAFAAYDEAAERLRAGLSAIVFVEGTRSRDGKLHDFKKGPFVLAIRAGVPIVPVFIEGTFEALPPGGWYVRRRPITLKIGEPVPTVDSEFDDRDKLMKQTRAAMLELKAEG
ncbi:MAG TPA: lysophospholipid acyltransferase family protein [Gemmatimonadales bacterium]|jgi:1-acyl-sn-glycerol-3-phosphate acyltransferase|nr:lysophospholipid acyltransferase family protein [Gemmatimonadales bacterium]